MAGFQAAQRRLDDDADIDDWMAQRNAAVQQLGPGAAAAGREAWAQSMRTGENLPAGQPADVAAIGAQPLGQDASPSELAAGERLVQMDNAKLADARAQRASMQTITSKAPLTSASATTGRRERAD